MRYTISHHAMSFYSQAGIEMTEIIGNLSIYHSWLHDGRGEESNTRNKRVHLVFDAAANYFWHYITFRSLNGR